MGVRFQKIQSTKVYQTLNQVVNTGTQATKVVFNASLKTTQTGIRTGKALDQQWSSLTGTSPKKAIIESFENTAIGKEGRQSIKHLKNTTNFTLQIYGSIAGSLTLDSNLKKTFDTEQTGNTSGKTPAPLSKAQADLLESDLTGLQSDLFKRGFGTKDGMNVRSGHDMKNLVTDVNRYSRKVTGKDITSMDAAEFHSFINGKTFQNLKVEDQQQLRRAHNLLGVEEFDYDPTTSKLILKMGQDGKEHPVCKKGQLTQHLSVSAMGAVNHPSILETGIRMGMGGSEVTKSSAQLNRSMNTLKTIGKAYKTEAKTIYKGVKIAGSGVKTVGAGVKTAAGAGMNAVQSAAAAGNSGANFILALTKKGNKIYLDIGQKVGQISKAAGAKANMLMNHKGVQIGIQSAKTVGKGAKTVGKGAKVIGKGGMKVMETGMNLATDPVEASAKMTVGAVRTTAKATYKVTKVTIKGAKFVGKTKPVQAVTKPVATITKKVFTPLQDKWKNLTGRVTLPGRMKNRVVSIIEGFTDGINGVQNAISNLVKKRIGKSVGNAAMYLFAGFLPILIGAVGLMAGITALTTIGDAVSDKLSEFKENTTMGATYAKLLEKEQEFNEAVINIKDSIPVPTGSEYSENYITEYTNQYVYYIGADGSQITWSGTVTWNGTTLSPNEVSDAVWEILKAKGWREKSIAGLLGNFVQESSLNPAALNQNYTYTSSSTGITYLLSDVGLAQWTKQVVQSTGEVKVNRFDNYMAYAESKGSDYSDIETQLNFLISESGYQKTVSEYARTDFDSAADAASWWMKNWEKPGGDGNEARRRAEAENMYAAYATGTDASDEEYIAANGDVDYEAASAISGSTYSTSTIKGILSMAAVYIEQDFDKYGAFFDGVFTDSVYKDYCAKLYDSTHIIGIDQTPPTIYYCPATSANEADSGYHAAEDGCNNKIPGGSGDYDWLNSGTGLGRSYSLSLTKEEATYEVEDKEGSVSTEKYDKYDYLETGPHGFSVYTRHSGDSARTRKAAREAAIAALEDAGCTHYVAKVTDKDEGYEETTYYCYCDLCRGHIDASAYVFISNIYDPTSDAAEEDDSYDNAEKTDQEPKYSMYVLDKYATAFDAGSTTQYVYCTNSSCSHYLDPSYSGYANASAIPVGITAENTKCPECGTTLTYTGSKSSHPGDSESVAAADATYNRQAEAVIMEELTGKPMGIFDWWNNENWFTNFTTQKTYFRLSNLDESIDLLKSPEKDANGDYNVINKTNSTPYWFNAFSSSSGRNIDFEKHGWDNDSITQVRLLMAADWEELYGIKDFGYISGAPLTSEQISQLIGNTEEWQDLCDDRASIIATTILLQQKAINYDLRYQLPPSHHSLMANVVRGDTFDCSSYVYFIMYNAGLLNKTIGSTADIYGDGNFEQISASDLQPGDILLKYKAGGTGGNGNHVVIYMGGDNISEAKGSAYPLSTTWNHSGASEKLASGSYAAYRLKNIDEDTYNIGFSTLTEDTYDEDTDTVIVNEGG